MATSPYDFLDPSLAQNYDYAGLFGQPPAPPSMTAPPGAPQTTTAPTQPTNPATAPPPPPLPNIPTPTAPAAPAAAPRTYNPAAGWDVSKLNNPQENSPKYQFGRAMQEVGGWGRGNLQPLVDYYNQHYGGHARVLGEDMIDMGIPGWNPIDIIHGGDNAPQWLLTGPGGTPINNAPGARPGGNERPVAEAPNQGGINSLFGTDFLNKGYADLISRLSQPYKMGAEQFESLRAPIDAARTAAISQSQAELADRGLLSETGGGGGPAGNAAAFIERNIEPQFAQAVQQAATQGQQLQTQNLLSALGGGTSRQGMLGQLALQNLAQNQSWQQFLANFGLNQQQVQAQIQQGNIGALTQLLQLYNSSVGKNTSEQRGYNNQPAPPPGA